MSEPALVLALPSKGRLLEPTLGFLADCGLPLAAGASRNYTSVLAPLPEVRVVSLAASEIPARLISGEAHLGVTGEDVMAEETGRLPRADDPVAPIPALRLGFGRARLVVAAPAAWIDVETMHDLDEVASDLYRRRRQRLRVATKYERLTRAHFARHRIADYRIVPSAGATEAAPAAGLADVIVDITTSGATLSANHLRPLADGEILASEAALLVSRRAPWSAAAGVALRALLARIDARRAARGQAVIEAALPAGPVGAAADAPGDLRQKLLALGCTGLEAFARVMSLSDVPEPMTKLRAEVPLDAVPAAAALLMAAGAREVRSHGLDRLYRAEGGTFAAVAAALRLA